MVGKPTLGTRQRSWSNTVQATEGRGKTKTARENTEPAMLTWGGPEIGSDFRNTQAFHRGEPTNNPHFLSPELWPV